MKTIKHADRAGRRRMLLGAAVLAAGIGLASSALADTGPVDLTIVDRATGQVLPFWSQGGRRFVAGEPGSRYGLRVNNHTGGRVLLVLSVDGVNVLTGDTAKSDQRGYVIDAYGSYDVNGWRKSQTEVAAFTFAPLSSSYASRTGRPGEVGVVGMAVFKERPPAPIPYAAEVRGRIEGPAFDRRASAGLPPPPPPPAMAPSPMGRSAPAAQAPSIAAEASAKSSIARSDEKLGTAHGAREWSSVTEVAFVRATTRPQSTRQIEYDTAPHLLARGVAPPYDAGHPQRHPRPFPLDPRRSSFVPDPPGGS